MKTRILLIIIFSLYLNNIIAQNKCGETTPEIDSISTVPVLSRSQQPINNATIRLFFHIVRKNNGSGNNIPSNSELLNAYAELNPIYNPVNICFVFSGFNFIDDTDIFNNFDFTDQQTDYLFNINFVSNAINIYIVPKNNSKDSNQKKIIGRSRFIPNVACVLTKDALLDNSNTLSHELGHDLGLYHTFETFFGIETLNGSNCGFAGDQICDTPADNPPPNQIHNNCNYSGGGGFSPLTNNVMSYYDGCQTAFTFDQGIRMRSTIANYPNFFNNVLTSDNISISQTSYPLIIGPASCNNPLPPSFCPPPIFNLLEIGKTKVSTSGNVVVNPASTVNNPFNQTTTIGFVSENEIELLPGFEVNEGAKFAAVISPACPASVNFRTNGNTGNGNPYELFSEEFNTQNNLSADMDNTSKLITKEVKSDFEIIPNPNNGYFEIIFKNSNDLPQNIVIIDAQGKEVNRIIKPNEYKYTLDIKEMRSGLYIINTLYSDKTVSKRFIKN